MATETTHKVKVDILGDASNLEKELKQITSEAKKLQKQADSLRKVDQRSAKQADKITRDATKDTFKLKKKSLALEKQLGKSIRETVKDMRSKGAAGTKDAAAQKKKVAQLQAQTKALTNLSKERRKAEMADRRAQGGRGGGAGRAGKYAIRGAGMALGAGAAYAGYSFTEAAQARKQFELQQGQAFAGTDITGRQIESLRGAGEENLFTPQEVIQQTRQLLMTTGMAKTVTAVLPEMMRLSRTQGMDVGAFQGLGGTLARGDALQKGALEKSIAAGMVSGLKKGRLTEYLQAVDTLVQRQQAISPGEVGATAVNEVLARLGSTGASGLQGARGAAVASTINEAIRNPQGEAAQMMMLQAVGMGEDRSFVEAKRLQERGIFDERTGIDTLQGVMERIRTLGGGNTEETTLLGAKALGLTIDQFEEVNKALAQGGTEEQIRERLREVQGAEVGEGPNAELIAQLKQSTKEQHALVTRTEELAKPLRELEGATTELKNVLTDTLEPALIALTKILTQAVEVITLLFGQTGITGEEKEAFAGMRKKVSEGETLTEAERFKVKMKIGRMREGDIFDMIGNMGAEAMGLDAIPLMRTPEQEEQYVGLQKILTEEAQTLGRQDAERRLKEAEDKERKQDASIFASMAAEDAAGVNQGQAEAIGTATARAVGADKAPPSTPQMPTEGSTLNPGSP